MNNKVSRRSLLGVALASTAVGMAGCAPSEGPATPSGSKPGASSARPTYPTKGDTITIMGQANELSKDQLAAFTKATSLKVKLVEYDITRLNSMIAAKNPPDVVRGQGVAQAPYLGARKLAMPLDDLISQSTLIKADDIASANDAWKWDGTKQGQGPRLGLANDYSQDFTIFYNKSMLKAAGVAEPTADKPFSYDDLLAAGKAITVIEGGRAKKWGLFDVTPTFDFLQYTLATFGGSALAENLETVDLTAKETKDWANWHLTAAKAGYGPNGITNPNPDGWDVPPFTAQKMAMMRYGFWAEGQLDDKAGAFTGFSGSPTWGTTRISPTSAATGYWIPAKAKNPLGGFAFIEWWCAGDGAKPRISKGGGLPTLKSMETLVPKSGWRESVWKVQENELQYMKTVPNSSPYADLSALSKPLGDNFAKLVKGQLDVDGYLAASQKAMNDVLAKGKSLAGS